MHELIMELRVDDALDHRVIAATIDILDALLDGVVKKKLEPSIIYVIGSVKSKLVPAIIEILVEAGMQRFSKIFSDASYKDKEFVCCLGGDHDEPIKFIIAKINVDKQNDYTTMSLVHLVKRIIRIFQEKKFTRSMSAEDEDIIVDTVLHEIPVIVRNAEVVRGRDTCPVPQFYM